MTDHALQSLSCPDALVALSFFSGAMGLDLGMAQGGIHARLACEVDNTCRQTIAANFPHLPLIGDISQYSAAQIRCPPAKRSMWSLVGRLAKLLAPPVPAAA